METNKNYWEIRRYFLEVITDCSVLELDEAESVLDNLLDIGINDCRLAIIDNNGNEIKEV